MKKLSGLEICRFLSALSVLFWHYQLFFVIGAWSNTTTWQDRVHFPAYSIFMLLYQFGGLAVYVFWAISGYIFFMKYGTSIKEGNVSIKNFSINRFSRLYPMHFATLISVALLQFAYMRTHNRFFTYSDNSVFAFTTQLAMASNWMQSEPYSFNGPIWSVSVEVVIYALFFTVVLIPAQNTLICSSVIMIFCFLSFFHQDEKFKCAILFFAGGLLSLTPRIHEQKRALSLLAAAIITTCLIVAISLYNHQLSPLLAIVLAFSFMTAFSALENAIVVDLSSVAWLGNLTYSSYLLHFPLQISFVLVTDALGISRTLYEDPAILALWLLVTFGGAWVAYWYLEMPSQNLIRAVLRSRDKRSTVQRAYGRNAS